MDLVIIGAGGHGREMALMASRIEGVNVAGFSDDNPRLQGGRLDGFAVLGDSAWIKREQERYHFICAIGDPGARRRVVDRLDGWGVKWGVLIDPSVRLASDAVVEAGAMVCAGVLSTYNVRVGRHAIVNLGCSLSHDVVLGDFATLACGVHLSGNVRVGEGAEIGVGTNVIQGMKIGAWSMIGAGAAVVRDIPAHVTAVGIPCKVIKEHR